MDGFLGVHNSYIFDVILLLNYTQKGRHCQEKAKQLCTYEHCLANSIIGNKIKHPTLDKNTTFLCFLCLDQTNGKRGWIDVLNIEVGVIKRIHSASAKIKSSGVSRNINIERVVEI